MSTVSEAQVATRRRALGRKLTAKGGLLETLATELKGSSDLTFLSDKERTTLEKQLTSVETIGRNFMKVGNVLEGKKSNGN